MASLLYKHFGISYRESEFELPVDAYYSMLAKALDYDELERYQQYVLAGGKPSKFKWSSPDKAGTDPAGFGNSLMGQKYDDRMTELGIEQKREVRLNERAKAIEMIARAQGREIAYIHPDGRVTDREGNPIERTREHIPFPLEG